MWFLTLIFPQALALLGDHIDKEDVLARIGAIMGLGLAYAGAQNDQECYYEYSRITLI